MDGLDCWISEVLARHRNLSSGLVVEFKSNHLTRCPFLPNSQVPSVTLNILALHPPLVKRGIRKVTTQGKLYTGNTLQDRNRVRETEQHGPFAKIPINTTWRR